MGDEDCVGFGRNRRNGESRGGLDVGSVSRLMGIQVKLGQTRSKVVFEVREYTKEMMQFKEVEIIISWMVRR